MIAGTANQRSQQLHVGPENLERLPFDQISGNSGTELKGKDCFEKFIWKISVNPWRLSFFSKIWKFPECFLPFEVPFLFMLGASFSPATGE